MSELEELLKVLNRQQEQSAALLLKQQEDHAKAMSEMLSEMKRMSASNGNAPTQRPADGTRSGPSIDALEKTIQVFEYDPEDGCTFNAWYAKYEDLFVQEAANVPDVQKVLMLMRKVSVKVDAQYRNSIAPKKPSEFTLDETVERLTRLFGDYKTDFEKRLFLLNLRMSSSGVTDFRALSSVVNKAVEEAKMAELTNDQLKTMFFMAAIDLQRHADTRFHLLSQLKRNESMSMDELVQESDKIAVIRNESSAVQSQGKDATTVHFVSRQQRNHSEKTVKGSTKPSFSHGGVQRPRDCKTRSDDRSEGTSCDEEQEECHRCGGRHNDEDCFFKDKQCYTCGKKGHPSRNCRSKQKSMDSDGRMDGGPDGKRRPRKHVRMVRSQNAESPDGAKNSNKFVIRAHIQGTEMTLQVDTQSDISMITRTSWEQLGRPRLTKADCDARCAVGESLKLEGMFECSVDYGGMCEKGLIYVSKDYRSPTVNVLGVDFIEKLDLLSFGTADMCPNRKSTSQEQTAGSQLTTVNTEESFGEVAVDSAQCLRVLASAADSVSKRDLFDCQANDKQESWSEEDKRCSVQHRHKDKNFNKDVCELEMLSRKRSCFKNCEKVHFESRQGKQLEGEVSATTSVRLKGKLPEGQIDGKSPEDLFIGRRPRSRIDLVKALTYSGCEQTDQRMKDQFEKHHGARARSFAVGDKVRYKTSVQPDGQKWLTGEITSKKGRVAYTVRLENGREIKAHANQLVLYHGDVAGEPDQDSWRLTLLMDTFSGSMNHSGGPLVTAPHVPSLAASIATTAATTATVTTPPVSPVPAAVPATTQTTTRVQLPAKQQTTQPTKQTSIATSTAATSSNQVQPAVNQRPQRNRQQTQRLNPNPSKKSYE